MAALELGNELAVLANTEKEFKVEFLEVQREGFSSNVEPDFGTSAPSVDRLILM